MTVAIPVEARKIKMEVDEKNIYRFGFALNTAGLKDTAATTNLAIQSAYSLLELRAKKLENRLKPFLRKLIDVVLKEINEENGTAYSQSDIYFCFEREIPTNAQENAQIELVEAQKRQTEITTILNLAGTIDDETKLQLICEQLDIDYQDIKDKVPKPEADPTAAAQAALSGVVPESNGGAFFMPAASYRQVRKHSVFNAFRAFLQIDTSKNQVKGQFQEGCFLIF